MVEAPKIDKQTENMFKGKFKFSQKDEKEKPLEKNMDEMFKGKLLVDTPY